MANPTVKPGIPKYASLIAALWVSDQIDQAGVPSKGAWDAVTGTFYPAYNPGALTGVAVGASGINALASSAAICGIELNSAFDQTTGPFNELGSELTMVALVRKQSASATRALIIQNTQKFTPPSRGGYQMYTSDAGSGNGNEYAGALGATSVGKTTGYPLGEWMLMVYHRGVSGVPKLYRNDVSNHDTDAGGTFTREVGTNGYERRPGLFNWAQASGVNAVPIDIAAVLLFRDGDISPADIQAWGGTSSGGVLVDPAAVLNAIFSYTVPDVVNPTITGPTGLAGAASIAFNIVENTTALGTWTADESVTWAKTGPDASLISLSGAGVCALVAPANYENPADAGANNTLTFTVTATDPSNNVSSQDVVVTITDENEVPTFNGPTISIPDGVVGTAITPIDVSSRFSDPDTGETIVYTKGGTWPVEVTLSTGGVISGTYPAVGVTTGLTVLATSSATLSVASNTFSLTSVSDSTGPTLTGSITVSNVTTFSYDLAWPVATDNVGVAGYDYSMDGGINWNLLGVVNSLSVTGRGAGTTDLVRIRARDAAGFFSNPVLEATVSLLANPDSTVPTLVGVIVFGAVGNGAYSATCPVAQDNVAVVAYDVQINGGSWVPIAAGGRTANISGRPPGVDTVSFRARDGAGNASLPLSGTVTVPAATTYGFTSEVLYYTTGSPVPQANKVVYYTIFIGSATGSLNSGFMYQGAGVTDAQGRLVLSGLNYSGVGELWMRDEDGGRYFQTVTVL